MILNDNAIEDLCVNGDMIVPYFGRQVRTEYLDDPNSRKIISYGQSSFGYDIRIGREFRVFRNRGMVVDPLNFDTSAYDTEVTDGMFDPLILPAHSYALGVSMEHFQIPADVLALCVGKSTYARCGIIVNVTPLEPGWQGYLTVEIANTTSVPSLIYPGQGIAQLIFFRGHRPSVTYADRKGKYQNQNSEPTPARI